MPLTAAQTTAFFENVAQMGIPNLTVVQIRQEGIAHVEDLVDLIKTLSSRLLLTCDALQAGCLIPILQRGQMRPFRPHLLYLEPSPSNVL